MHLLAPVFLDRSFLSRQATWQMGLEGNFNKDANEISGIIIKLIKSFYLYYDKSFDTEAIKP